MESISLLGMLFYMSYEDMRTHKVRDFLVLIFGIIGMMFHIMNGRISFFNIFGGFLLGFIMFFISLLTKEKIGKGDAFVIMLTGVFLGFWKNIFLLWVAFLFAGLIALFDLLVKKKKSSDELAFVPFIFLGYIFLLIVNGGRI